MKATMGYDLITRDPAMAAIMGVMPDNFGVEAERFGADRGAFSGEASDFGTADFGDDYFGTADFGVDFGTDDFGWQPTFGADATMAMPQPTPAALQALWRQHHAERAHTARRGALLEPNAGSRVKVERYVFAVNQTITLGIAVALVMTNQPDTNIRPQRLVVNAPLPGFATISEIKVANVSISVGGIVDAFDFNANAVGSTLDMPTLQPANRATILGNYTGFTPPGFVGGTAYLLVGSFKGPASIIA